MRQTLIRTFFFFLKTPVFLTENADRFNVKHLKVYASLVFLPFSALETHLFSHG